MDDPYQPVSCLFYDFLEAAATLGQPVTIVYINEAGATCRITDRVADLQIRGGAEYLIPARHAPIRLDRIRQFDGRNRLDYESCGPSSP